MKPSDLSFKTLCDFFEAVAKAAPKKKVLLLRRLLEKNLERNGDDLYEAFRLMLPYRDNERANYELKEQKLVSTLIKACSLDPKANSSAQRALEWKKPPTKHAGNFPLVMEEYLLRTNCGKTAHTDGEKELKIGVLNQKLDELAAASGSAKATVLAWLMRITSPRLMKWIICIILKDLKIGMSENTVFKEYHEDGIKLFNKTMNMRQVIRELNDPSHRILNEDVEPGQPVRAQLAITMGGTRQIAQRMKGKAFVIETKFDGELASLCQDALFMAWQGMFAELGERMQIHKKGTETHYYSRNGLDHGEQSGYTIFNAVLEKQIKVDQYILDCELVAWNKVENRFEPFGGLKSAFHLANQAKAPGTRLEMTEVYRRSSIVEHDPEYEAPTLQDTEIICVAFDVLHDGKESVIHKPLVDRHRILSDMVDDPDAAGVQLGESPAVGRVFPLVPYRRFLNGMTVSKVSRSEDDIQEAFENALKGQDEGIMVKDLASGWVANDRKGAWMKLKPDHAFVSEIDAVIIGGHFGTGRRRGEIAEYLLALAEKPGIGHAKPTTFISMCRVGTGVSDEERGQISDKLKPLFLEANHKRPNPPKCYKVTGHAKERPDVWIKDPFQSIVLEVLADIRLITSSVFATQQSLRFPRVQKIRWDKDAADIQTHDEFLQHAEERREGPGAAWQGKAKQRKPAKPKAERSPPTVASSVYSPVDVSAVQRKSDILKGAKLEVLSFGSGRKSKDNISKLIKELGGQMYMNMTPSVTHFLSESATHYQVAIRVKKNYDVLTLDWLLDVAKAGRLIPPAPRHYIFLTKETRQQSLGLDPCGDLYAVDSTADDVKALLDRHVSYEDASSLLLGQSTRTDNLNATDPVIDLEEELARQGYSTPRSSLFRGCKCVYLTPDDRSMEDAGPGNDLLNLQEDYLRHVVELSGGQLTACVEDKTTHVVASEQLKDAAGICEAVKRACGTDSLGSLHRCLGKGLAVVLPRWVLASFQAAARLASEGHSVQRVAEREYYHPAFRDQRWASWPWEEYGLDLKPKKRKAAAARDCEPQKRLKRPATKPAVRRPQQRRVNKGTFKVGGHRREENDSGTESSHESIDEGERPPKRLTRSMTKQESSAGSQSDRASEEHGKNTASLKRGHKVLESSDSEVDDKNAQPEEEQKLAKAEKTQVEKRRMPVKSFSKGSQASKQVGTNIGQGDSTAAAKPQPQPRMARSALLKAQLGSSDEDEDNSPAGRAESSGQAGHPSQGVGSEGFQAEMHLGKGGPTRTGRTHDELAEGTGRGLAKPEGIGARNSAEESPGVTGRSHKSQAGAEVLRPAPEKAEPTMASPEKEEIAAAGPTLSGPGAVPGKRLTLRERMGLRGITAKK